VSLIEILDKIKKNNVDAYKIRKVLEEYETFSAYTNDYITKYDMMTLILYYHFPQKDELHECVSDLLNMYIETAERMPMENKKKLIDFIVDYLDHD